MGIVLDPDNATPWLFRALVSNSLAATSGDLESALYDVTQAIALDPSASCAYNTRGGIKNNLGRHEEALADYNRAIRLDSTEAEYYSNRGFTYQTLGRGNKALADFDRAIELDARLAMAYSNRGIWRFSREEYEQALVDLDKAIELAPRFSNAYGNRGIVRLQLGQLELAVADLTQAIELETNGFLLRSDYKHRASAYLALHRPASALADTGRALDLDSQDAETYFLRAQAHAELGDIQSAFSNLTKAQALTSDDQLMVAIARLRAQLRGDGQA